MVGYPPQSRAGQPRADFGEDTSNPFRATCAAGIRARRRARILVWSFSWPVVGCGRFLARYLVPLGRPEFMRRVRFFSVRLLGYRTSARSWSVVPWPEAQAGRLCATYASHDPGLPPRRAGRLFLGRCLFPPRWARWSEPIASTFGLYRSSGMRSEHSHGHPLQPCSDMRTPWHGGDAGTSHTAPRGVCHRFADLAGPCCALGVGPRCFCGAFPRDRDVARGGRRPRCVCRAGIGLDR